MALLLLQCAVWGQPVWQQLPGAVMAAAHSLMMIDDVPPPAAHCFSRVARAVAAYDAAALSEEVVELKAQLAQQERQQQQQVAKLQSLQQQVAELQPLQQEVATLKAAIEGVLGRTL